MNRFLCSVAAAAALFVCSAFVASAQPKGHLVIIGGGERTDAVMNRFFEFAGGVDAKYIVISNASKNNGNDFMESLKKYNVTNVQMIIPTREECNDEEYLKILDGVTGVFFSGGLQTRITDVMRGTKFHERLLNMYEEGAVIGGTSAGAAIMTDPMLIAKHAKDDPAVKDDERYKGVKAIKADYMKTTGGMGFLKGAILDQHFLKRLRQNRMLCVALDHPELITMGIDEATALIVSNGNEIEVMGEGSVTVAQPVKETIRTNKNGYYGADIKFSLLIEGDKLTL